MLKMWDGLRLFLDNDGMWVLFLVSFFVSAALVAQRLWQILFRKQYSRRHEWVNAIIFVFVVSVFAVDVAQVIGSSEFLTLNRLLQVAVVLTTVFVSWVCVRLAFRSRMDQSSWRTPSIVVLFIVSMASAAWSGHRFYESMVPDERTDFVFERTPGESVAINRFIGITDRGREVVLYRWKRHSDQDEQAIASADSGTLGDTLVTIRRAEYDVRSNCHGWVFTGGRFLLNGQGVSSILEDNGYEAVTEPRAGDIVIYRLTNNEITHTGLVQGVLSDGTVIVESKWSVGGRFLHQPEDQPYSNSYTYYRTTRKHHVVSIRYRSPIQASNSTPASNSDSPYSRGVSGRSAAG